MGDTFKVTASSDKTGGVNAIIEVVASRKGGYRRDVILAGTELYEARANTARELSGNTEGPDTLTLHTKAFLIDHRYVFVGSLNLDPRSIELNAEMGLLIDSEALDANLTQDEEQSLASLTYRLIVNDKGKLEWHSRIDNQDVIETKEPLTGWWLRFKAWMMKVAPESQLQKHPFLNNPNTGSQ